MGNSPSPLISDTFTPSGSDLMDRLGNILQDRFEWLGIQIRQGNMETFDQLMECLDELINVVVLGSVDPGRGTAMIAPPAVPALTPAVGMIPNSGNYTISPVEPTPSNVLSRWPWVDQTIVDSIRNGNFDINNLPKLHREEEARNRHLKITVEGIFNPLDKTKPSEVLIGQTKMHQTFREPATFFSAWHVYASIHSSYHPDHGPDLALFSERIYFHIQLNYPWYKILNYILTFF